MRRLACLLLLVCAACGDDSAPADDSAEDDASEDDVTQDDVTEDDATEDDVAEDDVMEDDVADDDDASIPSDDDASVMRDDVDAGTLPFVWDGGLPEGVVIPDAGGPLELEIGIADFDSDLGFGEFAEGGAIPIGGLGQAGLTARLAVRVREVEGADLSQAFVRMEVTNVLSSERPSGVREFEVPDQLTCEGGWCYPTPIRVEVSHLAKLTELEGTVVTVDASIVVVSDESLTGSAHSWGYFEAQQ